MGKKAQPAELVSNARKTVKKTVVKLTAPKKTVVLKTQKQSVKPAVRVRKSATSTATKKSSTKSSKTNIFTSPRKTAKPAQESRTLTKTIAFRPQLSLTKLGNRSLQVLSPFRLPLDVDKLAAQTARYGGVLFVALGAIFTLFFSNSFFLAVDDGSLNANIVTSLDNNLTALSSPTNVSDSVQSFDFSGSDPMTGTVDVRVTLESQPISAKLRAKNDHTGAVTELGDFVNAGSRWEYRLDTHRLDDGDYQFQALVKYQNSSATTYLVEVDDDQLRQIANDVTESSVDTQDSETNSSETNQTNTDSSTTDDQVEDDQPVTTTSSQTTSLSGNISADEQLNGIERITVVATNAEKVKVELLTPGKAPLLIGYATMVSTNEWRLSFDTTKQPDGEYNLRAVLIRGTETKSTNTIGVTILNNDFAETPATEDDDALIDIESQIEPEISVDVVGEGTLTGMVSVIIVAANSSYIELYAQPKNSATQRYVGLPQKVDSLTWSFVWNTALVPNGEYKLVAKVKTPFGFFTEESDTLRTYNQTVTTQTEAELSYLKDIKTISLESPVSTLSTADPTAEEVVDQLVTLGITPEAKQTLDEQFEALMAPYQSDLDEEFKLLSIALRNNDNELVETIKARINDIIIDVKQAAIIQTNSDVLLQYIDEVITNLFTRVASDVERVNRLLAERTAVDATKDSDSDGISDFDEISLYSTNPFVADSDNDGFSDGAEILSGFDPTDSTPEVAMRFESPKETGIVREDILKIEAITTEEFSNDADDSDAPPVAILTGQALPNSFITLYIFSTPVIVTVKTNSDGSWQYRFDRELEDGEHEVYIGMTDNAGKIVAKSNPFRFVKEAQAYSPVTSPTTPTGVVPEANQSLLSTTSLLLVASIAVVAIGLVLMLLGIYIDNRRKLHLVGTDVKTVT